MTLIFYFLPQVWYLFEGGAYSKAPLIKKLDETEKFLL